MTDSKTPKVTITSHPKTTIDTVKSVGKNSLNAEIDHLNELEETMRDARREMTLEEKVADMRARGIDPKDSYDSWEEEDKENDPWEQDSP